MHGGILNQRSTISSFEGLLTLSDDTPESTGDQPTMGGAKTRGLRLESSVEAKRREVLRNMGRNGG